MTETFKVDRQALRDAVDSARRAQTDEEKRSSLETLATLLFGGVPFLRCKYFNTRTSGGGIDIVVQYDGWDRNTVFDAFGRYILLDCKSWNMPVHAKDVRHLAEKMQKSRVKLGIILAPVGMSGRRKGGQAVREIRRAFDSHEMCMLVISAEHLLHVTNGANFYEMLEYLIERTRFDFI
jgi:hypothetical protein